MEAPGAAWPDSFRVWPTTRNPLRSPSAPGGDEWSPVTDIREIVRRVQLGEPDRRIARDLGVSRNTVARYRVWADCGITGLTIVADQPEAMELMASLR